MTIYGIKYSGGCIKGCDYCSGANFDTSIDENLSLYLTEDLAKLALEKMANEGKFTLDDDGDYAIKYTNYCPMMQDDEEAKIVSKDDDKWDGSFMKSLCLVKFSVKES